MARPRLNKLPGRILALLAVAAMAAALMVSCSGPASPAPSETPPASGKASPTSPAAAPLPGEEPYPGPDLEQGMLSDYVIFLEIEGLPGESTDAEHQDWIDVVSYSCGVALPAGSISAGAMVTATAEHEDFVVVKGLDKASPKLNLYCCNAKQVPSVRVELCRASGERQKFMEYVMQDVIVTSVRTSGSVLTGEPVPVEEVSFAYGSIEWTYTEFDPVTGKAKGEVSSQWNLVQNKRG